MQFFDLGGWYGQWTHERREGSMFDAALGFSACGRQLVSHLGIHHRNLTGDGFTCLHDCDGGETLAMWRGAYTNTSISHDPGTGRFILRGTSDYTPTGVLRRHVWAIDPAIVVKGSEHSVTAQRTSNMATRLTEDTWMYTSRHGWRVGCPPEADNILLARRTYSNGSFNHNVVFDRQFLWMESDGDHVAAIGTMNATYLARRVHSEIWKWSYYHNRSSLGMVRQSHDLIAIGGGVLLSAPTVNEQWHIPSARQAFVDKIGTSRPSACGTTTDKEQAVARVKGNPVIHALAVSPDGLRFAVACGVDGRVVLYDTATCEPTCTYEWGIGTIRAIRFAPDGLRIAAAGLKGVMVWDVD